ncbi:LuxR family transcriptional regulator [Streptomyces radicis]|uniref:LuxR family transcriptional regulator n=2 Tax=Streptomyces radicis TaxID=1750517 RepID=A0A3A9WGQ6_9ACTN|nr:LuxR family transcriptional regulator [Streptomyces radicis]RKN26105.1 LuxR family transcriptional regulator [Streptomyces radicis]
MTERDHELNAIDGAVKACRDGEGQLLVIEGAPGLGKSSLLATLLDRATENEFFVLHAQSNEYESGFPYGAVHQLFDNWLNSATPEVRRRVLRGPAAFAAPLFDFGGNGSSASEDQRHHSLLYGLYWMCVHIAEYRPVALLLDDSGWIDTPSLRFLHYLAARLADRRILLAMTTDPAESGHQAEITRAIVSRPSAQLLRLDPLSEEGVWEHVTRALGEERGGTLATACHRATGGIPFFLNELLGELAQVGHKEDIAPARVFDLAPSKVVHHVLRRLAPLPPSAVRLIEAMAVLGTEADLMYAIDVSGLDQPTAAEALGVLADIGLLHPQTPPRFIHPIVRTAVYRNLAVSVRRAAHARAAEVLVAAAAPAQEIADHLVRAPTAGSEEAVAVLREAAAKSAADGDDAAAVAYLSRALQEPPGHEELRQLLIDLGRAELRVHRSEAQEHLSRALRLSTDPDERARIGLDLFMALVLECRHERATALLEELREESGPTGEGECTMLDIALLSTAHRAAELRPAASRRLRRLEAGLAANPGLRPMLTAERAVEALRRGEPAAVVVALAEDVVRTIPGDGIALPEHDLGAHSWCLTALALAYCDRLADAERLLTLIVEAAQQRGMALAIDAAYSLRAWVRCRRGRLDEARNDAQKVLDRTRRVAGSAIAYAVAAMTEVLTARHEFAAAEAVLQRYDRGALLRWPILHTSIMFARGRLRIASGQLDAGIEEILSACRVMEEWHLDNPTLLPAAEAAIAKVRAGRAEEAAFESEQWVPTARAFGAPRVVAAVLRASAAAAPEGEGIDRLEEAVDILARSDARLEHAVALIELGTALRRQGLLTQARQRLTTGMKAAQGCGAWGPMKVAKAELSAMGVRVRVTDATGACSLTDQERRVAVLASEGKRNRDIAHTLFVTIKTVEWHLNRVYRKLGISSREELAKVLAKESAESG